MLALHCMMYCNFRLTSKPPSRCVVMCSRTMKLRSPKAADDDLIDWIPAE
jgi:hypothetical protein